MQGAEFPHLTPCAAEPALDLLTLLADFLERLFESLYAPAPLIPFLHPKEHGFEIHDAPATGAEKNQPFALSDFRSPQPLWAKRVTNAFRKDSKMPALEKLVVLGAGNVGGTLAQRLAEADVARELALVDIIDGLPQGKALDIQESAPILEFSTHVEGTTSLDAITGADVVVETAGLARKPGMSRSDLLAKNAGILREHAVAVRDNAPGAVVIVVTNPVDVMTFWFQKVSGLPTARVFGESGSLDTARFRTFVALELNVAPRDVVGFVLGTHGDTMVPLLSLTSVAGVPITHLLSPERIQAIVSRTQKGGGEIVDLLKMGSAYYAPSAAQAELVRAVANDEHRLLPVTAALNGEYGLREMYLGVPAVLSRRGVERVVEVDLSSTETAAFKKSADSVRDDLSILRNLSRSE